MEIRTTMNLCQNSVHIQVDKITYNRIELTV